MEDECKEISRDWRARGSRRAGSGCLGFRGRSWLPNPQRADRRANHGAVCRSRDANTGTGYTGASWFNANSVCARDANRVGNTHSLCYRPGGWSDADIGAGQLAHSVSGKPGSAANPSRRMVVRQSLGAVLSHQLGRGEDCLAATQSGLRSELGLAGNTAGTGIGQRSLGRKL